MPSGQNFIMFARRAQPSPDFCQRKIEMSPCAQSKNVPFCRGVGEVHVSLSVPVKRRRAMPPSARAANQPELPRNRYFSITIGNFCWEIPAARRRPLTMSRRGGAWNCRMTGASKARSIPRVPCEPAEGSFQPALAGTAGASELRRRGAAGASALHSKACRRRGLITEAR